VTTSANLRSPAWPVRWIGRAIVISLGVLHTATAVAHESMNPDGIAYLDMADAWFRGEWPMALNAYWSPLYGWLLGTALHLGRVGPNGEFAAVHLVNLAIYLAALVTFELFWSRLVRHARPAPGELGLPVNGLWALGYALFIVATLQMIRIWSVTPDLCVAASVFLAGWALLRWSEGAPSPGRAIVLGATLGVGYLAKAAMFPLSFAFFAAALAARRDRRRALLPLLAGGAAFVLVAGPFVVALSLDEGHPTFGDSGRLNYVWFVNRIPYPHWVSDDSAGTPLHPTRHVSVDPPIYEFAEPVGGTYAPWYDPPYWFRGVEPRFDTGQQLGVLTVSVLGYCELIVGRFPGLVFVLLLLYAVGGARLARDALPGQVGLLLPAVAALSMYALVLVEERYIGPFVLLMWAGLLAGVRLPDRDGSRRLLAAASWVMVVSLALWIVAFNVDGLRKKLALPEGPPEAAVPATSRGHAPPSVVAEGLRELGLREGERIGIIGYGFDAFWARLARVRIVAELYPWEAPGVWNPEGEAYARMLEAFASTGVRAVVADAIPGDVPLEGWRRVGETGVFVRFFSD
jgi:hypothetical protein